MDLNKRISNVVTLDDYIELTQDVENKYKDAKIAINMSTILWLKKLRSLEIEYFNKCVGSGAAFLIFEGMLRSPASKTWGLLGCEVIAQIQYWLDAVRKHLISHHIHWWTFLRQILIFIKELRQKDQSLSSLLVQEIAESMLDLATSGKPDINQRYEILHTFNLFCAESTREIRLALKTHFEPYFIRLATIMATCGHLPHQFAALEALLRWLQPRQDPNTRRDAANKWFQPHLFPKAAVDVFLSRSWMNFFQDARDFLNCHNETQDLITSVICRKLSVGLIVIISGEERRQSWLDINSGSRSVTVMLEPQVFEALGATNIVSCETLTIDKDNAKLVKLHRKSTEVTLSISTLSPPSIIPSRAGVLQSSDVTVVLSSRSNMPRVDQALRTVFEDKYQVLLDVEDMTLSPLRAGGVHNKNSMDENPRFSHANPAIEKRRRPQSGFVLWSKRFSTQKSPSSTSTGSLARLHDKLVNLPYYEFTKEPVSVCAQPELSIVNELSESPISNSLDTNSTLKLRPCGIRNLRTHAGHNRSQSDTETARNVTLQEDIEHKRRGSQSEKYDKKRIDEGNISALFIATIGSADSSVIHDTIERLPKGKEINTDNLVDLLEQEALQSRANEERESDSGINTENGKSQEQVIQDSETIEDTQYTGPTTRTRNHAGLKNIEVKTPTNKIVNKSPSDESNTEVVSNKYVSKTTSDESNTEVISNKNKSKSTSDDSREAIDETPLSFVSVRKRNQPKKNTQYKKKETENHDVASFDNKEVEDFFSQHFSENQIGDVIISPTLAKKINESSTSSSEAFLMKDIDDNLDIRNEELPDLDALECLNDIVDKVCSDFEKCTKYLDKNGADTEILNMAKTLKTKENIPVEEKETSNDEAKEKENRKPSKKGKAKGRQTIKLTFTSKKQKSKPKAKGKLKLEPVSKMSTIIEDNNESDANKTATSDTKKISTDSRVNEDRRKTPLAAKVSVGGTTETPLTRKKRKLYSPKDDEIQFNKNNNEDSINKPDARSSDNEDDIALANLKTDKTVTPKPSTSSCYKEIENERKKYKRIRARKSKNIESPVSPKTKRRDDMFERLKDDIEVHANEQLIIVDKKSDKDIAIFNFTSDSEDEDFKQKKIEVQKRTSTTTIGSGTSVMSTRRGRTIKKPTYKEDEKDAKPAKRKRAPRRKVSKAKPSNSPEFKVDRPTDLVDEKMREAPPEELNTSFVVDTGDKNNKEPEPLIKPPELEVISDDNANIDIQDCIEKETPKQKITKKQQGKESSKDGITNAKKPHERKPTKATKKCTNNEKNITKKQDSETKIIDFNKDDDGTISPLPGLVIETEIGRNEIDDSITTNVVRKLQKIYKEGPDALNDTNTTQNMLSENEKPVSSPHMNITDEMGKIFGDDSSSKSKNNKTPKTSDLENKENSDVNVIDDTINSDQTSNAAESSKTKKQNRLKLKRKDKPDCSVDYRSTKKDNTVNFKNIKCENQQITDSQKSKKSIKSHFDGIDCDEIICIGTDIDTQSKTGKFRTNNEDITRKEVEILNITGDSENSEQSFATDDITGHGDINELPPSPKQLEENWSPRELQDMDPVSREYYIDFHNKVNTSKASSASKKNNQDEKLKTKAMRKVKDDSDSEPEQKSQKELKGLQGCKYAIEHMLPSRRETESENSSQTTKKVPAVSISRLSSEEIAKWSPSVRTTPESSIKSVRNKEELLRRSARTAKNVTPKETTVESGFKTSEKTQKTAETSPRVVRNRKSQISPINFNDFCPKRKFTQRDISSSKDETLIKHDDFMRKRTFARRDISSSKDETLDTQDVELASRLDSIAKKYFTLSTQSSPISRNSSEDSTPKTAPKRKGPVSKKEEVKRRKLDEEFVETIDISESRQSSNVEDWLNNILSTSKVDKFDASRDTVQNLMEKLKTTLEEIHQNTTKDFISLFVEAQKELTAMKEDRRRSYQETAVVILSSVTQALDQRFAQMDQEAAERESSFMQWLRARAADVLRRDCTRKRAMVTLLQEDVEAVQDYLARQASRSNY